METAVLRTNVAAEAEAAGTAVMKAVAMVPAAAEAAISPVTASAMVHRPVRSDMRLPDVPGRVVSGSETAMCELF